MKFRMLDTKSILNAKLKEMPDFYRDVTPLPLSAKSGPGGTLMVTSPYLEAEVPATTVKQLEGLAKVAGRESIPESLVVGCPKCKNLALIYVGMEAAGEKSIKRFECVACAHKMAQSID